MPAPHDRYRMPLVEQLIEEDSGEFLVKVTSPAAAAAIPRPSSTRPVTVVRVILRDGRVLTRAYTSRGRLHFVHRAGPDRPFVGEVLRPFSVEDVHWVGIIKTRPQML
jgi:hypothetical protein